MRKSAIISAVSGAPLFSTLTESEISMLIDGGTVLSVSADEELTLTDRIAVILKGGVSATKKSGDKKLLMRVLGVGGVSGVATLFSEDHSSVSTLTAIKPTEILLIGHGVISSLIAANPAFAMKYIAFLTSRIRFLNSRINAYTAGDSETKLALHLLLSDENESGQIDLNVSLCSLADMLDMSRASLYRSLDGLVEKGIIRRSGKKISILNRAALKAVSQG